MKFLRLVEVEVRRILKRLQVYYVDALADQLLFTLTFLFLSGIIYLLTEGNHSTEMLLSALIGFVTWRVADGCILGIADSVAKDAKFGTLEQVHLSAADPGVTLLARSLALLLYNCARGFLLAAVLMLILQIPPALSAGLILVFGLTQIGAIGVAYIITGLHLVYKNVASITLALSTALLFLTGAVTPLDNAPWLYAATRALPLTLGIELMREMVTGKTTLIALLGRADLYWLLIHSAVYGLAGWMILHWGQNTARRHGSLAHY